MVAKDVPTYICDVCPIRREAEANPHTLKARMWRLHTRVCPMYGSYMDMTGAKRPALEEGDTRFVMLMAAGMSAVALPTLFLRGRKRRKNAKK